MVSSKIADSLTFHVKNLGSTRNGDFTPKPLTLFCGPNNSGKTWAMYSLYDCYKLLEDTVRFNRKLAEPEGPPPPFFTKNLDEFNKELTGSLSELFNVPQEQLNNASFRMASANSSHLNEIAEGWGARGVLLMPAERNGLHLFYRELSTRRTALLHHASRKKIDINELLRDVIRSRYAIPIASYINWLNYISESKKKRSEDFHPLAKALEKELAGGTYKVNKSTGVITFKPYQRKRGGQAMPELDLHATSSSVKSLFGLWFYLEHEAQKGDVLMIDEPELNLHPHNQLAIARMLARLVNAGLRIVVSTHSDYIVREINTLLMLGESQAEDLRKKHRYAVDETLTTDQVAAYLFDEGKVSPFKITDDDGIHATTFNEVIAALNKVNNDVYYTLKEQQPEDG